MFLISIFVYGQDKTDCLSDTTALSESEKLQCVNSALNHSYVQGDKQADYLNLLLEIAARGNMKAVYTLGKLYSDGHWVERSLKESNELLIVSATSGHIDSQILLALNYQSTVAESSSSRSLVLKAREWLERAVENDSIDAKRELASHLLKYGQEKSDLMKAQLLLQEAARKGDVIAMERLIEFYGEQYRLTNNDRYLFLQKEWQTKINRLNKNN